MNRLVAKIRTAWEDPFVGRLIAATRPALMTALWTFLGLFTVQVVGYLDDVSGWFRAFGTPEAGEFPDPSLLGEAFLSGVMAAMSGLTSFAARMIGISTPPEYAAKTPKG